jgi:hypothetical protein
VERSQVLGAPVVSSERVTIRTGRAACDAMLMAVSIQGDLIPRPVVSPRTFDREDATVVVGDDWV